MAFDRKVAEKYFENFSTTTVIRVFNFIRTSSFGVERLFWIAILIVFSSLTVLSVTQTFQTFIAEPTTSHVTFMQNYTDRAGLRFDDVDLCVEVRHESLRKLYEHRIDDAIADILNGLHDFEEILRQKLAKVHSAEDKRALELTSSLALGSRIPTESEVAFLNFYHSFESANFDLFTPNEITIFAMTTSLLARLIDVEIDSTPIYSGMPESIQKLYQAYRRKGTDFGKLLDLIAEMTCVLLQLRIVVARHDEVTLYTQHTGYNLCKRMTSTSYFGFLYHFEAICYRLAKKSGLELEFVTLYDSFVTTMHFEALYGDRFATELKHFEVILGTSSATAWFQPKANAKQSMEFKLDTFSVSQNLRRRECAEKASRKGTEEDCERWCRIESIARACNCLPLHSKFVPKFEQLPERLRSCVETLWGDEFRNRSNDAKCRVAFSVAYDRSNCSQKCKQNCELALFSRTIRSGGSPLENANASTVVVLKVTTFVYEQVDEHLTMTTMTLVAAIGGNLSLYLGASFLALIHIVVFFIRLPFERVSDSSADASPTESNAVPAGISDFVPAEISALRKELKGDVSELRRELLHLLEQCLQECRHSRLHRGETLSLETVGGPHRETIV